LKSFRFSTADLRPGLSGDQRARAWTEALEAAGAVGGSEYVLPPDGAFSSDIDSFAFDGFAATRSRGSPLQLKRTPRLVRQRPSDEFVLVMSTAPQTLEIEQFGRKVALRQGEATLLATEETSTSTTHADGCVLSLALPRGKLAALCGAPEDWAAVHLGRGNSALALLAGYADMVFAQAPGIDALAAGYVRRHLFDLASAAIATAISQRQALAGPAVKEAQLARIRTAIAEMHADADFRIGDLAAALGLSPRYIQLLLAETEDTFSDCLRRVRLSSARRAIVDGAASKFSIADIAFASGFSDLSTFNRSFRKRFGKTPREMLREE
jgi:AraC-like DNA-binding protein